MKLGFCLLVVTLTIGCAASERDESQMRTYHNFIDDVVPTQLQPQYGEYGNFDSTPLEVDPTPFSPSRDECQLRFNRCFNDCLEGWVACSNWCTARFDECIGDRLAACNDLKQECIDGGGIDCESAFQKCMGATQECGINGIDCGRGAWCCRNPTLDTTTYISCPGTIFNGRCLDGCSDVCQTAGTPQGYPRCA